MMLLCTNCGSAFEVVDSSDAAPDTAYTCLVCEFYPVLRENPQEQSLSAVIEFGQAIRQTLIQARTDGLEDSEIIRVLKNEIEFHAELASAGHSFMVQLIDLGSKEDAIVPNVIPESWFLHQQENVYS